MGPIGLREAVAALRADLSASIRDSAGEDLRFEVGEITLQLQVEVERVAEGRAGIRFWVVDVGGGGSRSTRSTHVVTVPLRPRTGTGAPVLTGSGDAPPSS
jgi:hypothetical protein